MDEIMETCTKQMVEKMDDEMYKFLDKNGYHLERGNIHQIKQLRDKLATKDIQVRCETMVVACQLYEPYNIKTHGLIFFDSISCPRTREQVEELILEDYYKSGGIRC